MIFDKISKLFTVRHNLQSDIRDVPDVPCPTLLIVDGMVDRIWLSYGVGSRMDRTINRSLDRDVHTRGPSSNIFGNTEWIGTNFPASDIVVYCFRKMDNEYLLIDILAREMEDEKSQTLFSSPEPRLYRRLFPSVRPSVCLYVVRRCWRVLRL